MTTEAAKMHGMTTPTLFIEAIQVSSCNFSSFCGFTQRPLELTVCIPCLLLNALDYLRVHR